MKKTKDILSENVKKSHLQANSNYDYKKIQMAGEHFLALEWEEQEEEILFHYDVTRMTLFSEVSKEEQVVVFNLLIRAADFEKDIKEYGFSVKPENMYYNSNGRICIKQRDVNPVKKEDFLREYKASIACLLTEEYTFDDYMVGGEELYKKTPITSWLFDMENTEAIVEHLEGLKEAYLKEQKQKMILVNRRGNVLLKSSVVVLAIISILLGVYSGIQFFYEIPYLKAVTTADNAYIENNSIALIDALKSVSVERMDKHQKYILSRAYLQSENLADEQKKNVLEKLTLSANEKELEYWIYLGRLDVVMAEDLALQLSDDELLLYAYMKEKAQIQADTTITGTEKEQKLQGVQTKIDNLAEKYDLNEDQ